jgi:hypothetical protein
MTLGAIMNGAILTAEVFDRDAFRRRRDARMKTRYLPVLNIDLTSGVAADHQGAAQRPALSFERAVLRNQNGIFIIILLFHNCLNADPGTYLKNLSGMDFSLHSMIRIGSWKTLNFKSG